MRRKNFAKAFKLLNLKSDCYYKPTDIIESQICDNINYDIVNRTTNAYQYVRHLKTDLEIILELKLLADVGLVGFPNAGKSTLLSVVSAAKPEIADYPFTTLVPNLGMVSYRDDKSFVMADIPGIIEGASEGKGLGHRFLRHIERNAALLFMIPCDCDDIKKEYNILLSELERYNPELLDKERILAITKCDMLDKQMKNEMKKLLPENIESIFISNIYFDIVITIFFNATESFSIL